MRNVFLIIIFIAFSMQSIQAQIQREPKADKFTGTWIWESGNDSFIAKFDIGRIIYGKDTIEYAVGWHSYTKNGVLIESDLSKKTDNYSLEISNGTPIEKESNTINQSKPENGFDIFGFTDITMNKYGRIESKLSPDGKTMEWTLKETHGVHISTEGKPFIRGFTIPQKMTLRKVEE